MDTLDLTGAQVEPAARNAFQWHVTFSAALLSFYMVFLNDFVLTVCFYSIAGLSEESIYHTRKFSHIAATVVMYFNDVHHLIPIFLLVIVLLLFLMSIRLFFRHV